MLSDFMREQQKKLIEEIRDKPGYVNAEAITALAVIDILDILQDIRNPVRGAGKSH